MALGGFVRCARCREVRWIDDADICLECRGPEPEPPEPEAESAPPRILKGVRKAVQRKYEKGKLGAKPKRSAIAAVARALWEETGDPDRLVAELRAKGFDAAEPFEALVDFCEAAVRRKRAELKRAKA